MADISKIKLPDGNEYDIKDNRAVVVNKNNSVYTNVASAYVGATGSNPYWKITIPNISTKWVILTMYINIQQAYSVGYGGKLIINGYHSSTAPYTWQGLNYSAIGYLSNGIRVYACNGDTFYIEGFATGYFNIDVERVLVADSARSVDISNITVERVAELPEEYQTAAYRQNNYVSDVGNGTLTTFAYSKAGLTSVAWLTAWSGYELRAVSPAVVGNASLSALSAASADPTDTTELIRRDIANTNTFYRVTFSTVWNYIKSKIKSIILSTSTSSTSTTTAATSSAVKTVYDLANTANGTANTALSGVSGSLIYDHTYTISGGVATFTPHVYCKGEEVTSQYAASCFSWKYRLDNNVTGTPSYVNLTTDSTTKGCTVTISTLGYGGHVIGTFTPPA